MRAVQLALIVICIQVGLGLVTATGLFTGIWYESEITGIVMPSDPLASSDSEQSQTSINIFNTVIDTLTWGWIKHYFEPLYSMNSQVATFVNTLVSFLNVISSIIIGAGFIEFVRNRIDVLGSG